MASNVASSTEAVTGSPKPRAFDTIVYGGLLVGVLDILDAMIFYGVRSGITPVRILQSVAAGLLGRASYTGGAKTAALGLLLHFFNATLFAIGYYFLSRLLPWLNRNAVIAGLLYGVAAYFIMTFIVVPLSAIGPRTTPIPLGRLPKRNHRTRAAGWLAARAGRAPICESGVVRRHKKTAHAE